MLAKLKSLFSEDFASGDPAAGEHTLQLACAALMTEVATIDNDFDSSELSVLTQRVQAQFSLSDAEASELVALAETSRHDATSLHEFTSLINQQLSPAQKFELLKSMWSIAYADGHLDKYEEHIIRRAADLIHLSHSEFIRAKLAAKN